LNLNRLKGERGSIQTAKGYYLEGYPKNYSPLNLPHENNLDSALKYANQLQAAGVTFQYGRYEVRQGRYLQHSTKDLQVCSWITLPEGTNHTYPL
jgi:hypothetical protein